MTWLLIAILGYLFAAVGSLFDRYLLVGPMPQPKVYVFYVSLAGFLIAFLLLPFGLDVKGVLFLGLMAGLIRIVAVLFLSQSIMESEVSRVIPLVGGLLPIFSFFLFLPQGKNLELLQLIAFIFLVTGSVFISLKKTSFFLKDWKNPVIASLLFAVSYFLTKMLFLKTDFISAIFLVLMGGAIFGFLLFFGKIRKDIVSQKVNINTSKAFLSSQMFGGLGYASVYYALFLAQLSEVPLINALEGIKYVFLLFFVLLLSRSYPGFLKERFSWQKLIAVLLIGAGIALLVL